MIQRFVLILCLALMWPLASLAQDDTLAEAHAWEQIATRAESAANSEDSSQFAMQRLRPQLVIWRDLFLERTTQNAGRIATIDAQIAALGPLPETGDEVPAITSRRAELQQQRQNLIAPRILAEESYARANGLISEFDAFALQEQTDALTERGGSPLNPTFYGPAISAVWSASVTVATETGAQFSVQLEQGTLLSKVPRAFLFLVVAIGLLGFGRRRVTAWRAQLSVHSGRLLPLWLFLLSLVQLIVPIVGLYALVLGLQTLAVFGRVGTAVVDTLPMAGFAVVFAWWLGRHVFPVGPECGFLGYGDTARAAGRRNSVAIAWVWAIGALVDAAINAMYVDTAVVTVVGLPFLLILGFVLWRLGTAIRSKPVEVEGVVTSLGRMRSIVGKISIAIAVGAPLMVVIGFTAGLNLLLSWIYTLGVIGVIIILQRLVYDLGAANQSEERAQTGIVALLPVAVNFSIFASSLPIVALIWGARTSDLTEIWTRFREGFSIGDSKISPTDFLTFALVFGLGYILTRTIQGTLRKTVLPRTRLDLGGQNAVVAGFGYVGIILAAIIAITSAGIDLSNLAIVAGALSVGIGFGLQNIVSNFVSGIILLIERPVSEGDWIEVGGQMGYVRAISVRSTRIETFDRTDVIIPNADLVSGQVTNWTRGNLVGRVIVPVGVAYGTDVGKVTTILREIAEAHPLVVMTPPPTILFSGFGADSLDFEIRAILRDVNYVLVTKSEMNTEIARKFAEAGIEIPFAQRDIWLRNPEALHGDKT
jgi:small-conductance mechanosensitive channel